MSVALTGSQTRFSTFSWKRAISSWKVLCHGSKRAFSKLHCFNIQALIGLNLHVPIHAAQERTASARKILCYVPVITRPLQELPELLRARIDQPKNLSLLCDSVLISSDYIVDTIEESPVRCSKADTQGRESEGRDAVYSSIRISCEFH